MIAEQLDVHVAHTGEEIVVYVADEFCSLSPKQLEESITYDWIGQFDVMRSFQR